jgi:hypothetical protein
MEKLQHAMESIRVGGKSYVVYLGIICTTELTDLTCSASAFTVSAPGTTFPDIFTEMSNKLLMECITECYVAQF